MLGKSRHTVALQQFLIFNPLVFIFFDLQEKAVKERLAEKMERERERDIGIIWIKFVSLLVA